jgi:hypothetical protein
MLSDKSGRVGDPIVSALPASDVMSVARDGIAQHYTIFEIPLTGVLLDPRLELRGRHIINFNVFRSVALGRHSRRTTSVGQTRIIIRPVFEASHDSRQTVFALQPTKPIGSRLGTRIQDWRWSAMPALVRRRSKSARGDEIPRNK